MNIFNSLLVQLVNYDVYITRKINLIHTIFYHILSFYSLCCKSNIQICIIKFTKHLISA